MRTENKNRPVYPTPIVEHWVDRELITESAEADKNGPFHANIKKSERVDYPGLTKRELFAMAAMQGLLANEQLREKMLNDMALDGTTHDNYIAFWAVRNADELLKQLESTQSSPLTK